jgi:hypothetical protein
MERYAVIHDKFPREFVLLQGTGCRWAKCTFCDYHNDVSCNPFAVNRSVLQQVTGVYGVLDVINSGSGIELDEETLAFIQQVVQERNIHTIWFEMHYMYRHQLATFAARFASVKVKFRCGIESFDPLLRKRWNKGVGDEVTLEDVARYFQGVCLLCCTEGDSQDRIWADIAIARRYFEYFSVNVFCQNSTEVQRNKKLVQWFSQEVYPMLQELPEAEVLLDNRDLGVG